MSTIEHEKIPTTAAVSFGASHVNGHLTLTPPTARQKMSSLWLQQQSKSMKKVRRSNMLKGMIGHVSPPFRHFAGTVHQDETPVSSGTKDDARVELPSSRTLALIKPDAMQANHKDDIIEKIKQSGFRIVQEQQLHLSKEKTGLFYKEHEGKPFFQDLTSWMSSAPIYALVLEKQDAVQAWRHLMGPTNSNKARDVEPNSIRALFGTDGSHNAAHGSDSQASAEREIALIFGNDEPHVVEVQDLKDKFDTQDVCKPDAVDESKEQQSEAVKEPEATTEASKLDDFVDTKNAVVDHQANEVEPTVETKHLHTADLVMSQDDVTDLSQKEEDETINAAPKDVKKDETKDTRVAADTEEKEAAVADPVVVSLDAKLNVSLEDTAAVAANDGLPANTADRDDGASKEEQVVNIAIADEKINLADGSDSDNKQALAENAPDAKEAPLTDTVNAQEAPQVDAVVTVTVEATNTDDATAITTPNATKDDTEETDKPDTTAAANNTKKEDTHIEEKKDTKQTEEEPTLEKQDIKVEPEKVVIEADIVAANVDVEEDHDETKANTDAPREIEATVVVKEAKVDAVLEPVAVEAPKTELSAVPVGLEEEEKKELSTAEQDTKPEEPIAVTIHADIVTANVHDNDDGANHHQHQDGVTSDEVAPQEGEETQQTNAIAAAHCDVDADRPLDKAEEKNATEDHPDVNVNESATQEKEGDLISTTPTTTTTATATTTDTDANTPSNGNSSDSSKHSSVTADKSQVKENIKETHVNKKQPKLKAPGVATTGASSAGHPRSATATTPADKKKATSTGLRKPTSTLKKKPTTTPGSNGADAEDGKDKPKPKTRVPRVALLSQQPKKKPAAQDDAPADKEVKTKKAAGSTRSLVSRLTAPTAASARKKTSSATEGTTSAAATITTPKPADPVRQKKVSATATKKVPATTATTGSRVSRVSAASKPAAAAAAAAAATGAAATTASGIKKPTSMATKASGGVRRTSPPTSTTASKKADGTTVKRTTGTTAGTRAAASGLPSSANPGKTSTRKETLSTGSKLKKPTPATKKPSAATLTAPKKIKKADVDADATASAGSPTASSASKASSESSHTADHQATADVETSATPSSTSSASHHPDEAVETTTTEPVISDTNEAEADPVLDSTTDENNDSSSNNGGVDQELINESEIGSDVIVSSQDVTEDEKKATEKQDDIIVDLPKQETNNEQEVESVDIGTKEQEQDKVLIVEPSANQASDAEVAAITATKTSTSTSTTPTVAITSNKPQMASLRSRFENLNNNTTNNTLNHNQLQTTSSKEIRSKSPNRIADMINRFQ
ncbi:hypothetical protein MBANPS3_003141 [Mucor bainieri]